MHLILRILKFEEIIDNIIPSFNIFIEESDDLKAKFLLILPEVIDFLIKENFDTSIDQIVLNVFPTLESLLKKSNDEIREKIIEALTKISDKIGKKEASSSLNNIILSLVGTFQANEEIIYKLIHAFAEKYIKMKEIKEFCKAYHEEYNKTKSPLAKRLLAHALASISMNCKKNTSRKYVLPTFLIL